MRDDGVQFPLVDGQRSTQRTGRDVFASAAAVADPGLAAEIRDEPRWRTAYPTHLRALTQAAAASPRTGAAVAHAGLHRIHTTFVHVDGAVTRPLGDAAAAPPAVPVRTRTVTGAGPATTELVIPYRGREVRGADVLALIDDWIARGIVERPVRTALATLVAHPGWLDLRGTTFALLGAGAEMAPTVPLLRWGADVVAVDIARDDIWQRLGAAATAGHGRLHMPEADAGERTGAAAPGADLVSGLAAIRAWLATFDDLTMIGNYAYADGATFVRLSVAADAVIAAERGRRPELGVVCLATPTDVFAVPADVADQTRERGPSAWSRALGPVLRLGSRERLLVPNHRETVAIDDSTRVGIADSLVVQQGPNYALAKRLQRWRALDTHAEGGLGVVHVAPPTRTRSVVKNPVLAAAYRGASLFGVEIFAPATSRALMAALLVHDLRVRQRDGAPPAVLAEHELTAAAAHGGLWRMAWEPRTALPLAVAAGAPALLARGRGT